MIQVLAYVDCDSNFADEQVIRANPTVRDRPDAVESCCTARRRLSEQHPIRDASSSWVVYLANFPALLYSLLFMCFLLNGSETVEDPVYLCIP